jgi:glycosyltransferase involved in cell wall biosynthesis
MKLLILGGSNSRNSGGVFDTARMLGQRLHERKNVEVEYLMFDDEYSIEDRNRYAPLRLHSYKVKGPKKLGFSPDLYQQIEHIKPDIVHTQSLWMYLSYANKKYHHKTGTPYIISPHGMLDSWQLKQSFWKDLKKNIVLRLYEKKHLAEATCFHTLCQEEHDAVRALGFKNPIAIIPNGIELPVKDLQQETNTMSRRKKLLFLGRIHPKKGLDNLLEAWAISDPAQHNWQLTIAGETKDTAYMQTLIARTKKLGIEETVSFVGGQYGDNKHQCLAGSDAFILPSFSEGLPMSVLEAWSYRLPVLMTSFCNLPDGFSRCAAIRIETDAEKICAGIRKLVAMCPGDRQQMGYNGLHLVREKFTWPQVAESMDHLYNWVLGKSAKPSFVFTY